MSDPVTTQASNTGLTGNISWSTLASAVQGLAPWAIMVVLAKVGSPSMVGEFVLGLAIASPIFMLTGMQLNVVQVTDYTGDFRFGDYLAATLLAQALGLCAVGAFVMGEDNALVLLAVGASRAVSVGGMAFYGLMQRRERMIDVATSLVLKGSLSVVAFAGVLWALGELLPALLSWVFSLLLVTVLHDWPKCRRLVEDEDGLAFPERTSIGMGLLSVCRLWVVASPLALGAFFSGLSYNLPIYFLNGAQVGERELGLFGAILTIGSVGAKVVDGVKNALRPRLARYHAQQERGKFGRLIAASLAGLIAVSLVGLLVAWRWGAALLRIVYSNEYAARQDILLILLVAWVATYIVSMLELILQAVRRYRTNSALAVLAVAPMAVACWAWIPAYGLIGAAYAALAAALFRLAAWAATGTLVWQRGFR